MTFLLSTFPSYSGPNTLLITLFAVCHMFGVEQLLSLRMQYFLPVALEIVFDSSQSYCINHISNLTT